MYTPLTQEQFKKAQLAGFSTDQIIANEKRRKSEMDAVPQESSSIYGGGQDGIANVLKQDIVGAANDIQKGLSMGGLSVGLKAKSSKGNLQVQQNPTGAQYIAKGLAKAALRPVGDVAGLIFTPIGEAINKTGLGKASEFVADKLVNNTKLGNAITDNTKVQQFATQHPNAGTDFGRGLNLAFAGTETGKIEPKTSIPRTINQVSKIKPIVDTVSNKLGELKIKEQTRKTDQIISKRQQELANIEGSYATTRKANKFSKDQGYESRKRVASTDVLVGAVDNTGTIRTTQPGGAIDQYKAQTLDGAESTVRKNLVRLGEKVKPEVIQAELLKAIDESGLQGKDLTTARRNVAAEIAGYKLKADKQGFIPLELVHDAKISTTKQINYQTPPEVAAYRKAVAKGLKKTVENNSSFNTEQVNAEISKYLEDVKLLERLDGKKVKGGKLGKYFSQISGNMIGGIAGAAVGGPAGSAIGTIIGGELGGRIRGLQMEKSLGGRTGTTAEKSLILQKAIDTSNSPRLALPPRSSNLNTQIGTGKSINLPRRSQSSIDYSNSLGSRNTKYSKTTTTNKAVISESKPQTTTTSSKLSPLEAEAHKYKSAEEFVKSQGDTLYHGTKKDFDTFDAEKTKRGIFLSNDSSLAKDYSSSITRSGGQKYGPVKEVYISPDAKIGTMDEFRSMSEEEFKKKFDALKQNDKITVVFNSDVLKTKENLTEIYNKAVGKKLKK